MTSMGRTIKRRIDRANAKLMRALIYTRVSEDRAQGRSQEEQEDEIRAHCRKMGWRVVGVVTESGSASRYATKERPGWLEVHARLAAGEADVLVTWASSRAQRNLADYTELRQLLLEQTIIWSYSGREYDMTDARDRKDSAQEALDAESYSDGISVSVSRSMRANAKKGKPHGRRLYGYQRIHDEATGALVGQIPDDDQGPVVKRIFTEYLGGHGIRSICTRLTAEGVTTPNGGMVWATTTVRGILRNPAYKGKRVHKKKVVGNANWKPLVTEDRFDQVQARFAAKTEATPSRQRPTAYMLTGTARCGVCGGRGGVLKRANGHRAYQCRVKFCVARDVEKLDRLVGFKILKRLNRPDLQEAMAGSSVDPAVEVARAEAKRLRKKADEMHAKWMADEVDIDLMIQTRDECLAKAKVLDRVVQDALMPISVEVPDHPDLAWWEGLEPEVRREITKAMIVAVTILATGHSRVFDETKIKIQWRPGLD